MRRRSGFGVSLVFALGSCAVVGSRARLAWATPQGPSPSGGYVDRSGLSELIVWQGINGLFAGTAAGTALFSGTISDYCFDGAAEQSTTCKRAQARAAGLVVLGLAAGIGTPLLLKSGKPVRTSEAIIINRATLIGAMHGYILPFAAGLEPFDPGRKNYSVNVDEVRALAGLTFAGDVLGVGAGVYLAGHYDVSPGTASFLGTIHSATFIAAMSVGTSFPDHVSQNDSRLISALALGFADAALAVGLTYMGSLDIGRNRVFWLDTGGMLGWLGGAATGAVFAGDDKRAASIGGSLGMAAGIAVAYWTTRDSESWRRRHEPTHMGLLPRLEAPGLAVTPARVGERGGMLVTVQALRGTF